MSKIDKGRRIPCETIPTYSCISKPVLQLSMNQFGQLSIVGVPAVLTRKPENHLISVEGRIRLAILGRFHSIEM